MATKQYRTPGVYIQEPNSFPPSIVGVETALPCFIGFTEKAIDSDGRSLNLIPKRIESMAEFAQYFGQGYPERYYLVTETARGSVPATDQIWGQISLGGDTSYTLVEAGDASFNLYNSMRLFYANGGGSSYVISCDTYEAEAGITKKAIINGLEVCETFIGPTMVVIPDAVLLEKDDYDAVVLEMLKTCAAAQDRMAIIDIHGAEKLKPRDDWKKVIEDFRANLHKANPEEWRYGAAYFPPLVTSIVSADEIDITNFDKAKNETLKEALREIVKAVYPPDPPAPPASPPVPPPVPPVPPEPAQPVVVAGTNVKGSAILTTYVEKIGHSRDNDTLFKLAAPGATPQELTHKQLTQALVAMVPGFKQLLAAVAATQGVLPPSGAMAGVWTANDTLRGVWNAPANTGVATMIRPLVDINHKDQEDLNVPVNSMAVNAIRTFQGRGTLIWGARTLDSNSNDWRYIQVRRTMIYVEQSVKQALEAMVFKPNTAQTWVTVVAMIESFLHGLWASGGLMGGSAEEAYNVQAGLGSTMTPQDVLEGIMRVHITLQMVHPAEFIELTFKQQMLGGA
ncbi:MAG: uncharacterized protein QOJ53_382 [Sphingomonadales bacterium]|nr:uncharacterized protein [Sphingomonadales bacterium]